jgi:hypothetical protein
MADRLIECGDPDRMQPRPARGVREVVIESVNDLNGHRVLQSPNTRRGGAAPEIPEQGLRYPRQVYRDRLHDDDRNATPDERSSTPAIAPSAPLSRADVPLGADSSGLPMRGLGKYGVVRAEHRPACRVRGDEQVERRPRLRSPPFPRTKASLGPVVVAGSCGEQLSGAPDNRFLSGVARYPGWGRGGLCSPAEWGFGVVSYPG